MLANHYYIVYDLVFDYASLDFHFQVDEFHVQVFDEAKNKRLAAKLYVCLSRFTRDTLVLSTLNNLIIRRRFEIFVHIIVDIKIS